MMITNREGLEGLAQRLMHAPAIALDTEFLRERTYRAELCLLQIADAQGALCVDPLALPDLSPLHAVFGGDRRQGHARLPPGHRGPAADRRIRHTGI